MNIIITYKCLKKFNQLGDFIGEWSVKGSTMKVKIDHSASVLFNITGRMCSKWRG